MHPARWLESAFGSEARVRILRLLVDRPAGPWTERGIADAIGMSPNAVNRAIRSLREEGLVAVERIGSAHVVRLAQGGAFVTMLQAVFAAESKLWADTVSAVESSIPRGVACYLYGSSVAGTARGESDVDLLIVARDRSTAAEAAYAIELSVHRKAPARLHVIALDAREARRRLRAKDGLVKAAVENGVLLGGTDIDMVSA